LKGDVVNNC